MPRSSILGRANVTSNGPRPTFGGGSPFWVNPQLASKIDLDGLDEPQSVGAAVASVGAAAGIVSAEWTISKVEARAKKVRAKLKGAGFIRAPRLRAELAALTAVLEAADDADLRPSDKVSSMADVLAELNDTEEPPPGE